MKTRVQVMVTFAVLLMPATVGFCLQTKDPANAATDVDVSQIFDAEEPKEIPFPATVDDLDVGGAGRYICLHFKSLRKIGVFDTSTQKIVHYVSANDDATAFAAGLEKLVVVGGNSGVITRYDLATGKRELTQSIDIKGKPVIKIGSASTGPAIMQNVETRANGLVQVDLQSLKPTDLPVKGDRGFGFQSNCRISANGETLAFWASSGSPSGLLVVVKKGASWEGHYEHTSVGYIVPSPNGRVVYTARGIYTNETRAILGQRDHGTFSIPALTGEFYLSVSGSDPRSRATRRGSDGKMKETVELKMTGDDRALATIPNLKPVYSQDDQWSRQSMTLDKRLFLIPNENLILQLANSKDKFVATKFDIEAALKASDVEYLFVQSQAPTTVKAGEKLSHQFEVKSRKGGVSYSLESAPEGMELSDQGRLTWNTSKDSPRESAIIVAIGDQSGQQLFHTFKLKVIGASGKHAATTSSSSTESSPVMVTTEAAKLEGEFKDITLPATSEEIVVGGRGRYLLIHLPTLKKIAVLDISQAKIVHYFPASDDNTKFVAGATRAVIFSMTQGVVSRYRLDNFERELTTSIPYDGDIKYLAMGSGSEGPIMLRCSNGTGQLDSCFFSMMDLQTLRRLDETKVGKINGHSVFRENNTILASTNGAAFVVGDIGLIRWDGNRIEQKGRRSIHNNAFGYPSANGKYFLAGDTVLNENMESKTGQRNYNRAGVPSVTGNYYITVTSSERHSRTRKSARLSGKLFMFGDSRPLVTIQDLLDSNSDSITSHIYHQKLHQRLFFVPDAKVIATVSTTRDAVRLRHFDIDKALNESGVDYLIVDSQAPRQAVEGANFEYQLKVKSKQGGVTYQLDSAPEGMKISNSGLVSWDVPKNLTVSHHKAIVSISDKSGQSTFHTFSVDIPGVEKRLIANRERKRKTQQTLGAISGAFEDVVDAIGDGTSKRITSSNQKLREIIRTQQKEIEMLKAERAERNKDIKSVPIADGSVLVRPEVRTWTDRSGQHKIEARFVEIENRSTVKLKTKTGETRSIELKDLSSRDAYFAVELDLQRRGKKLPRKLNSDSPFKKESGSSPFRK